MRYMGGKSRIAKQLAEVIDRYRQPGQLVWDAFCGGLSMSVALSKNGPVWSTDACVPLISLYRAVQNGWDPPTEVSLEEYRAAKELPDTDPMKAFCGFGCSFGGMWFAGKAAPRTAGAGSAKLYSMEGSSARILKRDCARGMHIDVVDFLAVEPQSTAALLYLDPPYSGTQSYDGVPPFDHARFAERVGGWAQHTHVFVSEYAFPVGECVWSKPSSGSNCFSARANKAPAVERLYHIHPGNV